MALPILNKIKQWDALRIIRELFASWTTWADDGEAISGTKSDGKVLGVSGGALTWVTASGVTPPGADGNILYNDGGSWGASDNFTWDAANASFIVTNGGSPIAAWNLNTPSSDTHSYARIGMATGDESEGSGRSYVRLIATEGVFIPGIGVFETIGTLNVYAATVEYNGHTVWHAGNDGSGSTLDADTVDSYQASALLLRANHTGTQTLSTISDAGSAAAKNTGTTGDTVLLANGNNTHSGNNTFDHAIAATSGVTLGVSASNGNVYAGGWSPTKTHITNIASSNVYDGHYIRVGNRVTCELKFDAAATAVGYAQLDITLPITSNLSAGRDLAGSGSRYGPTTGEAVYVQADTSNDRASIRWYASDTSNRGGSVHFSYEIK